MVRLEAHKEGTEHKAIEKSVLPARVYIPLSQHLGKACISEVNPGDHVLRGQRIAGVEAKFSSPIHAPISGKVMAIQEWVHCVLGRCKAIVIDSDGEDRRQETDDRERVGVDSLTPEQIRAIVFEAGIVGMGGSGFPAHIKLAPPKPVDTLIVNGAECEPYLTCDYRLMIEKTKEILLGIGLAAKTLSVKNIYIAIEDDKPEAIKAFGAICDKRYLPAGRQGAVSVLKSSYPQGGERRLIKNILHKEVPSGGLPFDIGTVVHNVATIHAIYEAVYLNKPLYERVITVTGSCLSNPRNLLVRLGTPVAELISACGPLKCEPEKVIIGGPMMGIAQYTQDVPVIKSTTGIVVMGKYEAVEHEEEFCVRCGACVRACPAGLTPCLINLASEKELWIEAKAYAALDCIECGLCNYVCPANRKLTQSIRRAKLEAAK